MLEQSKFHRGRWTGLITASAEPQLRVTLNGEPVEGVSVAPDSQSGRWQAGFDIPAAALGQGVHSFVIEDAASGTRLGVETIITGVALEDDLRAEIAALRAEVEMLKRSLRRLASGD